jgi:hypothetical protein
MFKIYYLNSVIKKLLVLYLNFNTFIISSVNIINVPFNFHVFKGSFGSRLFNTAKRYLNTLLNKRKCDNPSLNYYLAFNILANLAPVLLNLVTRDVIIVFNRFKSISQLNLTKRTKIKVTYNTVSLFVQLI